MLLSIDEKDERPIYQQIIGQVREKVRAGSLKTGDELPSVRELADGLGVNMHTVRSAYLKLREQGIISMRLGRRARVARWNSPENRVEKEDELAARLRELITDAVLMGYSTDEFLGMARRQVGRMKKEKPISGGDER